MLAREAIESRRIAAFVLAALALCLLPVVAQQPYDECARDRWQFSSSPEHLRMRLERLCRESATRTDEWGGRYSAVRSETSYDALLWAPGVGFLLFSAPDGPSVHDVSYGTAELSGQALRLHPEVPIGPSPTFAAELRCVRWGETHYLIPRDRLVDFCYAVNSGSREEVARYLTRSLDPEPPNSLAPEVPDAYRKYLAMSPIAATILTVTTRPSTLDDLDRLLAAPLTLSAGAAENVRPGMKMWLHWPTGVTMSLRIVAVSDHTSEARVVEFERGPSEPELGVWPKQGWKFVNRPPKQTDAHR